MSVSERQKHFLQEMDPLVKEAVSSIDPQRFIEKLRDSGLTVPQREAIRDGVERNILLVKTLQEVMEDIPQPDLILTIETAGGLMRTDEPVVPIRLAGLFLHQPQRAATVMEKSVELIQVIVDIAEAGFDLSEALSITE